MPVVWTQTPCGVNTNTFMTPIRVWLTSLPWCVWKRFPWEPNKSSLYRKHLINVQNLEYTHTHLEYHHLVGQNIFCRCIKITMLLQKYSMSTPNSLETKQWKLKRVEWMPFLNFTRLNLLDKVSVDERVE